MRFEYILLLILSVFPLIYKLWYWQHIFKLQSNNIWSFIKFLVTKEGRESVFHFWTSLELPIFVLSFGPIFNPPFEYFFYSIFFYFLVFYNIFVLWKIFRKKIFLPEKNIILLITLTLIWLLFSLPIFFQLSIYLYITSILLFIPLWVSISIIFNKHILSHIHT